MVIVYSHTASPRLLYLLDFLSHYYGQPFILADDKEVFLKEEGTKINYSNNSLESAIQIVPTGLLFQKGIHPIEIHCFQHQADFIAFFKTDDTFGFDLFAAIFYLLTRYEEYLPHQKDEYGRYAHQNSLAFKNDFLRIPLINVWLEYFRKLIAPITPNPKPQTPNFSFLPTYDIDMAWSYREKGFVRNMGGLAKSIVNGQWAMAQARITVLRGKEKDPFDCYDWLEELHSRHSLQPVYFFHAGKRQNAYDKSISVTNKAVRDLICITSKSATIGLHPSWHSGDERAAIGEEKESIEAIIQQPVTASRQHYIRFTLPQTFRHLLAAGITDDYSMGYGSINGFRASIASPFYWYDLERGEKTALLLHPFCFMDANSYYEQKDTPQQAFTELEHYYNEVKKVNGRLITVWHNSILGTDATFQGWREIYERFIAHISQSKA
ncbi:MAG: hypothetical protein JWP69_2224 [Flaviaesturariibacter sp.]|nr:hypothetical protein [Flaviaesturariibacter sp.]